jgi:hypothetical protein
MKKHFYGVLLVVTTLLVVVFVSCNKETTIEKQKIFKKASLF